MPSSSRRRPSPSGSAGPSSGSRRATSPSAAAPESERAERLGVVLHVLYLIFNEGYTASSGPHLQRGELTSEAIRLAREVRRLLPNDGEVAGLLALMLLTDARRAARTRADGSLVPLAGQDRKRWNANYIEEGVALVTDALARTPLGAYQLQAAIAAVHDEAARADRTPTGSRSSPSTSCSSASRPIRWSPSITPWPWQW